MMTNSSAPARNNGILVLLESGDVVGLRRALGNDGAASLRDKRGRPALILAAEIGNPELGEALLDAGAKIDATTLQQETALLVSLTKGHEEFSLMLMKRGADSGRRDQKRSSPSHIIAANGLLRLAAEGLKNTRAGAEYDKDQRFAVTVAMENGNAEVAYSLFKSEMKHLRSPVLENEALFVRYVDFFQPISRPF